MAQPGIRRVYSSSLRRAEKAAETVGSISGRFSWSWATQDGGGDEDMIVDVALDLMKS